MFLSYQPSFRYKRKVHSFRDNKKEMGESMVSVLNKKIKELLPRITHLPPFLPGSSLKLMDADALQIHGRSHPLARITP